MISSLMIFLALVGALAALGAWLAEEGLRRTLDAIDE